MDIIDFDQNNGKNARRKCWAEAGTFCGGIVQGDHVENYFSCINCDFYKKESDEQRRNFTLLKPGQKYHKSTLERQS